MSNITTNFMMAPLPEKKPKTTKTEDDKGLIEKAVDSVIDTYDSIMGNKDEPEEVKEEFPTLQDATLQDTRDAMNQKRAEEKGILESVYDKTLEMAAMASDSVKGTLQTITGIGSEDQHEEDKDNIEEPAKKRMMKPDEKAKNNANKMIKGAKSGAAKRSPDASNKKRSSPTIAAGKRSYAQVVKEGTPEEEHPKRSRITRSSAAKESEAESCAKMMNRSRKSKNAPMPQQGY